jgi:acetyl-CoA synthetase
MYTESVDDPEAFWSKIAGKFHWDTPCAGKVLNYNFHRSKGPIQIEWFKGGTTNICYNALDRHLGTCADKTALIWEGNDGETSNTTFAELHALVCRFANVLKSKGVKKGDPVTLYMPMVIELPAAMLACARIGYVLCTCARVFKVRSPLNSHLSSVSPLFVLAALSTQSFLVASLPRHCLAASWTPKRPWW